MRKSILNSSGHRLLELVGIICVKGAAFVALFFIWDYDLFTLWQLVIFPTLLSIITI